MNMKLLLACPVPCLIESKVKILDEFNTQMTDHKPLESIAKNTKTSSTHAAETLTL